VYETQLPDEPRHAVSVLQGTHYYNTVLESMANITLRNMTLYRTLHTAVAMHITQLQLTNADASHPCCHADCCHHCYLLRPPLPLLALLLLLLLPLLLLHPLLAVAARCAACAAALGRSRLAAMQPAAALGCGCLGSTARCGTAACL
jgi:hypothetical protein